MRIWSIHPQYLDVKAIVALWRESLLAQNVLLGETKGYKNHPQLTRFKQQSNQLQEISNYLHSVCDEADKRCYKFNRSKILQPKSNTNLINVTSGQVDYEWKHLIKKLEQRDIKHYNKIKDVKEIASNPIFNLIKGDIENWERL